MRMLPACLALLLLPALGGTLRAAPQDEPVMRSSDVKKLARPVSDWLEAKVAGKTTKQLQDREKILATLESVRKSLKGQDPLTLVADWEIILETARDFPRSGFRKGKAVRFEENPRAPYLLRVPKRYNPGKEAWPLLYLLDDAGADPEETLKGLPPEILDRWLVVARDMQGIGEEEFLDQGALRLAGLPRAVQGFRVDRNRMAILGIGSSVPLAARLAAALPHFFAAVALVGGEVPADVPADNLARVQVASHPDLAAASAWLQEQPPRDAYPLELTFSPLFGWAGRAYWVQATRFETADSTADGKPARVQVRVDRESNTITIEARYVRQLTLYLNDRIVDLDRKVTVVRNGVAYEIQPRRTLGVLLENFLNTLDTRAVVTAMVRQLDVPDREEQQ